ncbi:hypothetical protein FKM82_006308 [Ascaphus truei]
MAVYNKLLSSLVIFSLVSFICTIVFNALSAIAQKGLFLTTASNVSSKYSLEITPAGWTFSIWSVIYIWNGLWILYIHSTLFRRNKLDYVYIKPRVHPPEFFGLWILNNLINIAWLFLWDREYLIPSMFFLGLLPITCFVMLCISYSNCYRHGAWLSQNQSADLWCTRILVHNGLAMYATWTSIATLINFGLVLKYEGKVEDAVVSTTVLCLVLFVLLFWFLLETFIYEKYVRYTFTVYPVAIVALVGVFLGRDQSAALSSNDILTVVLIGVSTIACILRFALLFSCDKLRPLFSEKTSSTSNAELHVPDTLTTEANAHANPIESEMLEKF